MSFLVDSSVWIDILGRRPSYKVSEEMMCQFLTCPPVIQEVFQGLRNDARSREFKELFHSLPCLAEFVPLSMYLLAADIYSTGRRRGYTIRSAVDALIAAIAIEYNVPVFHKDRDFTSMAKYTKLQVITKI